IITLTGTNEDENISGEAPLNSGTKFLMIMEGGQLELHGSSRDKVSWTQISAHANAGSTAITLAEPVNWEAGDQIVIAPSGFDPREAEQVTVTAVDGNQVSFTPALQHDHWGTIQTYEGKEVDQRAEVGLLTRNIRIQGDEDSLESNFGGHTMIMPNASARVEGVEFYRMGQMGHAARYPLHWHLLTRLGDGSVPTEGQYAKNNSVHASFHRAIVVHGTNDILVERNIAYDVWSHTFVPAEDGDEYNNRFIENLGLLTKRLEVEDYAFPREDQPHRSFQAEHRAGTFWLRNPFNELIGNHAAGAYFGIGFFYDGRNRTHQIGVAINNDPSPITFRDNVAHSNFQSGGGNDRYPPTTKGYGLFASGVGKDHERLFDTMTSYKNYGGIWIEELSHQIDNAIVADNAVGIIVFRGQVEDTLHIGETANEIDRDDMPRVGTDKLGGGIHIMRQQGGNKDPRVRNMTFVNEIDAAYVYLDTRAPESENYILGSKLVKVAQPFIFFKTPEGYIVDADGSLTGTGANTRIYSENLSNTSGCTHRPEWQAYLCPSP
ncbi:MAG: G8 domain-containing protein, partial [Chloroflexota bacterium]